MVESPSKSSTSVAAQAPGSPAQGPVSPIRRIRLKYVVAGVFVLAVLGILLARWTDRRGLPDGLLQANGRIEGDQVTIASKFSGRVGRLAAREGKTVHQGETIATLDDAQADARVAQMQAGVAEAAGALAQARARVSQAEAAVSATDAKIRAAYSALEIVQGESAIRIRESEAGLDGARASLSRAENAEVLLRRDYERYKRLSEQGDVEVRRSEQAELSLVAARNDLTAARSQVIQAEQQLTDAKLGPQRVRARQDEIHALEAQRPIDRANLDQAQAALAQAQAAVRHAEAGYREAISTRADLTIVAPTDGVVMTRTTEEGEVVAPGSPLLTLVDLDHLYLRVFVPEAQIGMLRLGLPALIYTDAFPDKPFPATVRYISSRAEFSPREVQTPEERVKLVFAVKLYLDANPDHRLTPGLPADAMIRWKDGAAWTRPRW